MHDAVLDAFFKMMRSSDLGHYFFYDVNFLKRENEG